MSDFLDPYEFEAAWEAGYELGLAYPTEPPATELRALPADERHAAQIMGFDQGQEDKRQADLIEAEHEAAHQALKPLIQAVISDMNARGVGTQEEIKARMRARQVEASETAKSNEVPWAAETGNTFGRVRQQRRQHQQPAMSFAPTSRGMGM